MAATGSLSVSVVVVGAGPTGLTTANLLGSHGIDTLVIERHETTVQAPRAVSIDDEALRTMQAAGLIEAVITDLALDYGSHYFTPSGRVFAKVEPALQEFGYPRRSAFQQPVLEATLRTGLDRFSHVQTWFGHSLEDFTQSDDGVTLVVRTNDGALRSVECRYLVAADGASSTVRGKLGIAMTGSTYEQRWLIVDLVGTKDSFRQTRVFCDPRRPAISLPGPNGSRRFEFMLHDGESTETAETEANARRLLRDHGPDGDAEIIRRQVYTFHARTAETWSAGAIFLAGDAAHLTPPFAGQGMNSGIRDAHNLAWKLAAVLQGRLPASLLESYQQERKPHAWALIELAITLGRIMMPPSRLKAAVIQNGLRMLGLVPAAKDYVAQMKFKPRPRYDQGFLRASDVGGLRQLVGTLFPQPRLEAPSGAIHLLDAVIGNDFALVILIRDPMAAAATLGDLSSPGDGITRICITPRRHMPIAGAGLPTLRDLDGTFDPLIAATGDCAVLLRPDHYVAAALPLRQAVADPEAFCGLLPLAPQQISCRTSRANFDHTGPFDRDYFALWQGALRHAMWDIS